MVFKIERKSPYDSLGQIRLYIFISGQAYWGYMADIFIKQIQRGAIHQELPSARTYLGQRRISQNQQPNL